MSAKDGFVGWCFICIIMWETWASTNLPSCIHWHCKISSCMEKSITHHEVNVIHSIFQTISSYLLSPQKSKLGFSTCQGMNPRSLLKHKRKKRIWGKRNLYYQVTRFKEHIEYWCWERIIWQWKNSPININIELMHDGHRDTMMSLVSHNHKNEVVICG